MVASYGGNETTFVWSVYIVTPQAQIATIYMVYIVVYYTFT